MGKKYIGIITDENGEDSIGYGVSTDVDRMLKWKKGMDQCNGIIKCAIYEITEYSTIPKYGKN